MANILDTLGSIGKAVGGGLLDFVQRLPEVAAYEQAARGNTAPLQMIQEQKRQQNLLQQLQTMSKEEMEGPFGETLKRQLQFGDVQGVQKTLTNIPRYKQVQELVKDPNLGLKEADQMMIQKVSSVDPQVGLELLRSFGIQQAGLGRQKEILSETFKQRAALEEKKTARQEAKLPGNVVAKAIEEGQVTADDIPGIVGVLQASGVKLPANESEARIFASRILNSPKIKKLVPAKEQKGWMDSVKEFFTRPQQQAPAPSQAPAQPQKVLQFDPKTGTLR